MKRQIEGSGSESRYSPELKRQLVEMLDELDSYEDRIAWMRDWTREKLSLKPGTHKEGSRAIMALQRFRNGLAEQYGLTGERG